MKRRDFVLGSAAMLGLVLTGCGKAGSGDAATDAPVDADAASAGEESTSDWWENVPRASWSQFEELQLDDDWYSAYRLPNDTIAIVEDGQWEEAVMYLISGSEKTILLDTGLGMGNIRAAVDQLAPNDYSLVISHYHRDHIGGMSQFADKEIRCFNLDSTVEYLTRGLPHDHPEVQEEIQEGSKSANKDYPEGFDIDTYCVKGVAPTGTLNDGDTIDLGGRTLQVLHTPGHTADCMCLLDEGNCMLFTTDTYYPADLFAFSADSSLPDYAKSIHRLVDIAGEKNVEWLMAGHNETVKGAAVLTDVAAALDALVAREDIPYTADGEGTPDEVRYYEFETGIVVATTPDRMGD